MVVSALVRGFVVVTGAALAVAVAACAPPPNTTFALAAPSGEAARAVVAGLLEAARRKDAQGLARAMCDKGEGAAERAAAALRGPLRIDGYEVARVEPAWRGSEPYFRVEATLLDGQSVDLRSLSVRAREGCVDRVLGEPLDDAQPAEAGALTL